MTTFRTRLLVLTILYILFAASLFQSAFLLPVRVATHFGINGNPDGWMDRSTHLITTGLFGCLFPAFFAGLFWSIRYFPTSMINLPHRDYWLDADHRSETLSYLFHHSLWLACLAVMFVTGLNWVIVFSNQQVPVHLPPIWALATIGMFLCGMAIWLAALMLHFCRPRTPSHLHPVS